MTLSRGRPRPINWPSVLSHAAGIVESYDTSVTLRQLFYRLVAALLIPNDKTTYKTLSKKSAVARRAGWFPELIDPGRYVRRYPFTFESPEAARLWLPQVYRRDRTEGQDVSLYLGVEKAGMVEQLRAWFEDRGLPIVPLGGYSSHSFVMRVRKDVEETGRPAVLLYAGDFDPSGEDIDRDFVERTACFVKVQRIALNADQVSEYDLPPQPGKAADSRARGFVARHGVLVQVELDALPPETLRALFEAAVGDWWDEDAYAAVIERERIERASLAASPSTGEGSTR